jgi:3-methyladenine DNA glycosylase AlkD
LKTNIPYLLNLVNDEIAAVDMPENWSNYQQFFREKLEQPIGLKVPVLRKVSNKCYREVRQLPPKEILKLCDGVLASNVRYTRFIAFEWASKLSDRFQRSDFNRFQTWLKKYIDNWGNCDHLCGSVIGQLLLRYPDLVHKTDHWTRSRNRWLRRASAVSLIVPVRKKLLLTEIFARADVLLTDSDDMVQKGYGWMLKEAGNLFPDEVFDFVMARKDRMPRTALRYAIEKFPAARRRQALARD